LYTAGSVWILTMMQSCASAAKLRAAGPFSLSASVARARATREGADISFMVGEAASIPFDAERFDVGVDHVKRSVDAGHDSASTPQFECEITITATHIENPATPNVTQEAQD